MKLNKKPEPLSSDEREQLARRLNAANPVLKDAELMWRVRHFNANPQGETLRLGKLLFVCETDSSKDF